MHEKGSVSPSTNKAERIEFYMLELAVRFDSGLCVGRIHKIPDS